MRTRSLPVLILCFVSFLGLIFSHSFSFSGINYVPYNYQAFAEEDDSGADDSGGDDSSSGSDDSDESSSSSDGSDDNDDSSSDDSTSFDNSGDSSVGDSGSRGTDSFASPPTEEAPTIVETPPVEAPAPPPPPIEQSIPTPVEAPAPSLTCEQGSTSPECPNVPEPPGQPVEAPPAQSITVPPANNEGGSAPPANEDDGATGAGSVPFIAISPTNPTDNKESDSTKQAAIAASAVTDTSNEDGFQRGVKDAGRDLQGLNGHGFDDSCPKGHTAAFCDAYKQGYSERFHDTKGNDTPKPTPTATPVTKQTDTSNEDGFQQGVKDANRDLKGLNGHGFDDSCPKGHTASFCEGYKQGYHESWYDTKDNDSPAAKPTTKSRNAPHSGGEGGNGTPNIKIADKTQQQKVIVKVNTKVDTATKNVIVNNIVTAPSQGKQPTYLLLLDTAQLCQLAGDTQCVSKQNEFKTLNLATRLDSTGKTWTISGQAENIAAGTKTQRNVQITAYFYDSKGNNVGGGSSYQGTVNPSILKSLQSGAFNFKASTSIMKGTPSFLRLEYQTAA